VAAAESRSGKIATVRERERKRDRRRGGGKGGVVGGNGESVCAEGAKERGRDTEREIVCERERASERQR